MERPTCDPSTPTPLGGDLVFVFCPPRSGSTMLGFMLDAHSRLASLPEPHVMVPLPYLGYYDKVDKAGYDAVNASLALKEFVAALPGGEDDYLAACRAYAATLYRRALATKPSAARFVDKTPPNVLHWPFIAKVFPDAHYVILVRHPLAVAHSLAETFFTGDYRLLLAHADMVRDYVRAIAAFLRQSPARKIVTRYEDLVADPAAQARRLAEFLGLEFEPAMVEYGTVSHRAGSLGDPMNALRLGRPTGGFDAKWVAALRADGEKLRLARELIDGIDDADLAAYGYNRAAVFAPLAQAGDSPAPPPARRRFSAYLVKRRVYFALRGMARWRFFRRVLESLRYYCDTLLRD